LQKRPDIFLVFKKKKQAFSIIGSTPRQISSEKKILKDRAPSRHGAVTKETLHFACLNTKKNAFLDCRLEETSNLLCKAAPLRQSAFKEATSYFLDILLDNVGVTHRQHATLLKVHAVWPSLGAID